MALAFAAKQGQNGGGTVSDARTGKRFPLELPIKIHKDAGGDASGVTGNLSAAGVYIRADQSLEMGSPVEFEITLPPEVTGKRSDPVSWPSRSNGREQHRCRRNARRGLRHRFVRVRAQHLKFRSGETCSS
jgi:hypothetical protein